MFLGRALELCQSAGIKLIVLPYDFAGYEQVNEKVAEILFRYAGEFDGRVNQVSCDEDYMELFLPVRDSATIANDAESIAQSIRRDVFEATECTASIGAAKNMFLAKVWRFCVALVMVHHLSSNVDFLFIYRAACYRFHQTRRLLRRPRLSKADFPVETQAASWHRASP
jgi:nucleotidyltransferase/DNA polymerase involved in DNA repair